MCKREKGRTITVKEELGLSPWKKWSLYRRIPIAFLIRALLVVFVSTKVMLLNYEFTAYESASYVSLNEMFMPPNYVDGLFTIEETLSSIDLCVATYYNFTNNGVDYYEHIMDSTGKTVIPVIMEVKTYTQGDNLYTTHPSFNLSTMTRTYNLSLSDPLGPLNSDLHDLQEFFRALVSLTLTFRFYNYDVGPLGVMPFLWSVGVVYDFQSRGGVIDVSMTMNKVIAGDTWPWFSHTLGKFIWLHATIVALAIALAISTVWDIISSMRMLQITSNRLHKRAGTGLEAPALSCGHRLGAVRKWTIFSLTSSACLTISGIVNIIQVDEVTSNATRAFLGVGCLLVYIDIIQYMEYTPRLYGLVNTLRHAIPVAIRFSAAVVPIYIGFAMAGVMMFSPWSVKFSSLDQASVTLFSLINGDEVSDTFASVSLSPYPWLGQAYCYCFVLLFISSVMNVFIFIIEDAFDISMGYQGPAPNIDHRGRLLASRYNNFLDLLGFADGEHIPLHVREAILNFPSGPIEEGEEEKIPFAAPGPRESVNISQDWTAVGTPAPTPTPRHGGGVGEPGFPNTIAATRASLGLNQSFTRDGLGSSPPLTPGGTLRGRRARRGMDSPSLGTVFGLPRTASAGSGDGVGSTMREAWTVEGVTPPLAHEDPSLWLTMQMDRMVAARQEAIQAQVQELVAAEMAAMRDDMRALTNMAFHPNGPIGSAKST